MKHNLKTCFLTFFAFLTLAELTAADRKWKWNGSVNSNWDTKANWTTSDIDGSVGSGDTVVLDSNYINLPVLPLGTPRTIRALELQKGGMIDLEGKTLNIIGTTFFLGGNFSSSGGGASVGIVEMDTLMVNFTGGPMVIPANVKLRVMIAGHVDFIDGIIDNATYFELYDDVKVYGASDASHIKGQVMKTGDDAFTFPVGDGNVYAPMSVTAPTNTGHYVRVQYFNDAFSDLTVNSTLDHVSLMEYWTLEKTGPSNMRVTMSFRNPRSGEINDLSTLRAARYNGSDWEEVGDVTEGTLHPSRNTYSFGTVQSSPGSSINNNQLYYYTLGSDNTLNPLPIELLQFNAATEDKHIALNWSTIQEKNNDFFTVEKSLDGSHWFAIGRVEGALNSETTLHYTLNDMHPVAGMQYYRLRQTDLGGEQSHSYTIAVAYSEELKVSLYPNPASDLVYVRAENAGDADLQISLCDMSGRILYSEVATGSTGIDIRMLSPGMYTLLISCDGRQSARTIVKP